MPPRDPQAVLQKLGQQTLKVDSFFLKRTGFIANQTILKLGEYNLSCVPATIGLSEGRFLAVLTPSEVNLFSRFKAGLHILILTFDDPDNRDIARFPLRVGLSDLVPVPERKNLCYIDLRFKSLPGEFVLFLGTYLEELDARQESWDKLSGQSLELTPQLAMSVGAGYGFVLVHGEVRLPAEILSFDTKKIDVRLPEASPMPTEGASVQLKLAFQGRPLTLEGTWSGGSLVPEYHSDWLSFVEECQFQINLAGRGKPRLPR